MTQTLEAVAEKPRAFTIEDEEPISRPASRWARLVPRPRKIPRWAMLALVAAALVSAISWWFYAGQFESTDDAQIDGHLNSVSARVSGTVIFINPRVENNQYVEAGTLLLELDPNDNQAALDHARADLATREGEARSAGVNLPITHTTAFSRLRLAEAARDEATATAEAEEASLVAAQHKVR